MVCHKCGIKVEDTGFCPTCDSGMLHEPEHEHDGEQL
jgi:RNA polymerase subunit RPABC4/transcription elongation factor Spt4